MKEIKDIPGFEGLYAITTTGEIFSYPREWKNTLCGVNSLHKGKWIKTYTLKCIYESNFI